jgi:hypothetical protein
MQPVESRSTFWRNIPPPSSLSKIKPSKKAGGKQSTCFLAGFLLGMFFNPEDGGSYVPLKRLLTFGGLHSVVTPKIVLITTTVRVLPITHHCEKPQIVCNGNIFKLCAHCCIIRFHC